MYIYHLLHRQLPKRLNFSRHFWPSWQLELFGGETLDSRSLHDISGKLEGAENEPNQCARSEVFAQSIELSETVWDIGGEHNFSKFPQIAQNKPGVCIFAEFSTKSQCGSENLKKMRWNLGILNFSEPLWSSWPRQKSKPRRHLVEKWIVHLWALALACFSAFSSLQLQEHTVWVDFLSRGTITQQWLISTYQHMHRESVAGRWALFSEVEQAARQANGLPKVPKCTVQCRVAPERIKISANLQAVPFVVLHEFQALLEKFRSLSHWVFAGEKPCLKLCHWLQIHSRQSYLLEWRRKKNQIKSKVQRIFDVMRKYFSMWFRKSSQQFTQQVSPGLWLVLAGLRRIYGGFKRRKM